MAFWEVETPARTTTSVQQQEKEESQPKTPTTTTSNSSTSCKQEVPVQDFHVSAPIPTSSASYFEIANGPRGRGLFATQDIPPRTVVHVAPCIPVHGEEYLEFMKHTVLEHYLFNARSKTNGNDKLLALGYGSLFNHAKQPNIDYRVDKTNLCITYMTGYKPICQGEELCITYGSHVWFDDNADTEDDDSSDDSSSGDSEQDPDAFLGRMLVLLDEEEEY